MFIYFLFSHSSSAVIMILICLVSFTIHVVFGTFVSTPPATGTNCTGSDVTLSWAYTPPAGASTNLVEWKKGDDSILILVVSTGQLVYGNIYDNTGLIHIADGEIKLLSINESTSGAYTCEVRYSSGSIDISNQHVLNVIDIFNTSITCTCDSKEIHCVLPTQINKVTINGTLHSLPYRRSDATSYHICMAGEAASCLADSIDKCVTLDSCPKGSTSRYSLFGLPLCASLPIVLCVIIIILYVIYRCSNKNCKTHAKCWKCSNICHSEYPLVTTNSSKAWKIEHYCCLKPQCPIKVCNKKCCSLFLCCGCCLIEFPAKRVNENGQSLTRPPQRSSIEEQENNTKRKKKKKKANHSVKEHYDKPNLPAEKHTKEGQAVHTATVNNTTSDPNPPGERRLSLDSFNLKSNKIYPEEEKQVNNTKILDPIMLKSGNIEITHSSTPRPLPVLPPIEKKTS